MTHFTPEEYQVLLARNQALNDLTKHEADPGPESEIAKKIKAHSKQMGWPEPLIFPQTLAVRNFLPPGFPDCVIPIPHHILLVELKAGKAKLGEKQKLTCLMFMALGHTIHKINSFKGYLGLIEKLTRSKE
jgi:hypothetical protein